MKKKRTNTQSFGRLFVARYSCMCHQWRCHNHSHRYTVTHSICCCCCCFPIHVYTFIRLDYIVALENVREYERCVVVCLSSLFPFCIFHVAVFVHFILFRLLIRWFPFYFPDTRFPRFNISTCNKICWVVFIRYCFLSDVAGAQCLRCLYDEK